VPVILAPAPARAAAAGHAGKASPIFFDISNGQAGEAKTAHEQSTYFVPRRAAMPRRGSPDGPALRVVDNRPSR
jgi:hypothetical protein